MMKVDTSKFMEAMRELKLETAYTMREIMNWQMALWCKDIIKKIATKPGLGWAAQKKMGKGAVSADLNKLFHPISEDTDVWDFKPKKMAVAFDGFMVKPKSGGIFLVDRDHFRKNMSQEEMRQIHLDHRNKQGRVRSSESRQRKAGNYVVVNDYFVKNSSLNRYIKFVQGHVGRTKASWLKALNFFQSKAGEMGLDMEPVPDWVTKHSGWAMPYSVAGEQFNAAAVNGYWTAGSNVPWITDKDQRSVVNATGMTRIRDIKSGKAAMRLQKTFNRHAPLETKMRMVA